MASTCGPISFDHAHDDRASIIWFLQSGSPSGQVSPVKIEQAAIRGRFLPDLSVEATDLLTSPNPVALFGMLRSQLSWSPAYAVLAMNGFSVASSSANAAIHKLRRCSARNQLADIIVQSYERLSRELSPLDAASPEDIFYLVVHWPMELRPRQPFFARMAVDELKRQNDVLRSELDKARARLKEDSSESERQFRNRRVKRTVVERAHAYLAVLANHHYGSTPEEIAAAPSVATEGSVAKALTALIEREVGTKLVAENTSVLMKVDTLQRILSDGLKNLDISVEKRIAKYEQNGS